MYCPNCGKEISDNSNFCINCGSNLKNFSSTSNNHSGNKEFDVNNELVIKQHILSNIFRLLGAFAFVIIGIWMLLIQYDSMATRLSFDNISFWFYFFKIVGTLSIIYFGFCFIVILKKLIEAKPILIVNKYGIIDNSTAMSIGFIPWKDIENIHIQSILTNKFIIVNVKDEKKYLDNVSSHKRKVMLANKKMGYGIICISLNSTGVSPESILPEILNYMNYYKNNQFNPDLEISDNQSFNKKDKKSTIITFSIVLILILCIALVIYLNYINFFDEKSKYYVATPNTTYTISVNNTIIRESIDKIKEYDHYIVIDKMGVIYTKNKDILKYLVLARDASDDTKSVYRLYTIDNKSGEILVLKNYISSASGEDYILENNAREIMKDDETFAIITYNTLQGKVIFTKGQPIEQKLNYISPNLTGIEQAVIDGNFDNKYITDGITEGKLRVEFYEGNLDKYYITYEECLEDAEKLDIIIQLNDSNLTGIERAIQEGAIGDDYLENGVSEEWLRFAWSDGNLGLYYDSWEECLQDAKDLNILREPTAEELHKLETMP